MSSGDDDPALADTHSPLLADRPIADDRARAVARSKVANALFATTERVTLGRYHLLERLGEGGMGVVWGAFDPELERRVAIKLVRAKTSASRERILAEGQALAKLSHPNVVAVHDVGVVDDEVYLVMEWIRGHNLRVHAKEPRSIREIVALYRAAGEGLLAAHRSGLVHRDFKPENVMVGDDGRVRVLDFGLAFSRDTDDDVGVAGTPRYMAPEQQRGEQLTEAADQYAFGIALREALGRRSADETDASVPAWLTTITDRATAPSAADRYASLDELLRALARDPATIWRRRALAVGALAAVGVAFVVGTTRAASGPEPCGGGADELSRVWNPERRTQLLQHGKSLGPYGTAEAQRLESELAAYGSRWIAAHRSACIAHRRAEVTPRLYERGLACIVRARAALGTVVDILARAPIATYPNAVVAARSLPDVDRCLVDATESQVAPPDPAIAQVVSALGADATRASYLALAADPRSVPLARSTLAAAEQLGYAPLIARSQLALGQALSNDPSQRLETTRAFAAAATTALAAFEEVLFVEAFARELFAARHRDAVVPDRDPAAMVPFVEVVATRAGDAAAFARTLFLNNVGTSRLAAGDPAGAESWFRRARAEIVAGASGVEVYAALGNLAMVTPSHTERDALFAEQRTALERVLGPTHAMTLTERMRAAGLIEDATRAATALGETCAAFVTWHPQLKDRIVPCHYELAWLANQAGDTATARHAYTVVAASEAAEAARARAQLALFDGNATEAERIAIAEATESAKAEAWFQRFPGAVDAYLIAAEARHARGDRATAISALRAALAVLDDPRINRTVRYDRRRTRVESQLRAGSN